MSTKYRYEFTPDAFKQNFRNLLEDLEALAASILSGLAGAVLLAGRAGGQQVAGGTAASEDLTFTSNATATKDRIFFGSAQTSAFDEPNGRLGMGTAAPSNRFHALDSTDVATVFLSQNTDAAGTTVASAQFRAVASTAQVQLMAHGSGRTLSRYGLTMGGWAELVAFVGNGLVVGTSISAPLVFGTNSAENMRLASGGNLAFGGTGSFGGGAKVIFIANATTAPTTNPTGGGVLYCEGGALKFKGSGGTVTTIAPA